MIIVGKVYLDTRDKNFYFVSSITKIKGRIHYVFNRINSLGFMGASKHVAQTTTKKYKSRFKIQPKILVKITFKLPKEHRDKILWNQTIKNGKSEIKAILRAKDTRIKAKHRLILAKIAYYSVGHYLSSVDRESNLRDFAKAVGFKVPSKFYPTMVSYLDGYLRPNVKNVKKLQDSTIRDTVSGYKGSWELVHGFSKKLDVIIEADFNAHLAELRRRNLTL